MVPKDLAWKVISDPVRERLIDVLCTKQRAIEHALEIAAEIVRIERRPVRVQVLERDGQLGEELSFA